MVVEDLFPVPDQEKFTELTKGQIVDEANNISYRIGSIGVCNDDALNIAFTLLLSIATSIVEQMPHEKDAMKKTLGEMFGVMLKIYDDITAQGGE